VEDFISRGKASFVIYTPVTPAAGKSGMRQFNEADIPVVMFDRYTAFGDRLTFIEYDAYNRGQIAANEIMKDAKKQGLRKADICLITGKLSDKPAIDTKAGFYDVVNASGGYLNVLSELDGGWQQIKATDITEDWLGKYKKIDYIFGSNPDMGLGASVAVKAAGRTRDIKVVAGGEAKGVYEAIYRGELWMTTGTNPKNIILWCLQLGLMATTQGYPFEYMDSLPSHALTPLSVITKDNIQEEWNKLWPNERLK
jgi:ribose transport system substrate-binding protein